MSMLRSILQRLRDDERGWVAPMFVVLVPVLMLATGLVVDGAAKIQGNVHADQVAASAARAATAAVSGGAIRNGSMNLNGTAAYQAAMDYVNSSGFSGSAIVSGNEIRVAVWSDVETMFLGTSLPISGSATAALITQ